MDQSKYHFPEYNDRPFPRTPLFTRARLDQLLFGEHTGIFLGNFHEVFSPRPIAQSNVPPRETSLRGNPWFMAPGWASHRRYLDVKYHFSGPSIPKIFANPWDRKFGTVGSYMTQNLEVIRANQMAQMSFI